MGLAVIRGTGKQNVGAIFTLTAYLLLGIPLAYFFGLHQDLGTRGIWIGPTAACAYLTIAYNILIVCMNWQKLFEEVRERRNNENAARERLLLENLK